MKLLSLLLLCGCAAQPMTESELLEREYRLTETHQEWLTCKAIYSKSNATWFSTWTSGPRHENGRIRPRYMDMRMDLGHNGCDSILKRVGYK